MPNLGPLPIATLTLENFRPAWFWLAVLVVMIGVLYGTYEGIFQRSRKKLSWLLLALRGAGVLALYLALVKPTWTREHDIFQRGQVGVVLDNSQSMGLRDPSGHSRYQRALDWLDSDGGKKLRAKFQVSLFDINGRPYRDNRPPSKPEVERTDLATALRNAASNLRGQSVAGLVLISDGVDNTGRASFSDLQQLPDPVYTVGFQPDPRASRFDLALKSASAPPRVLVNNEVKVSVVVAKTGGPEMDVPVVIKRGRDQFADRRVHFPAGDSEQPVALKFTPSEAGSFAFTASVPVQQGERLLTNNAQHFPLRVDAEAINVFYLEGFMRPEYKFLKRRLEDDPDVSLVSLVRAANPRGPRSAIGEVFSKDKLAKLDVVILGDLEGRYLDGREYRDLVDWVYQGHGLIVLGGYASFGPDGLRATPLADALPVVFAEGRTQSEEPFRMKLTEEGLRSPLFEITGDRVKDAALWAAAPTLSGLSLVDRAKAGATVLAVHPSLRNQAGPYVVLATQNYGSGHTLVLTADTTWRWTRLARMMGQADTLYTRFWSQTIRYLSGKDLKNNRPPLVVSTDRPDYRVKQPVTIRAVRQASGPALASAESPKARAAAGPAPVSAADAEVQVEVTDDTGRTVAVPVRSSSAEPNLFVGTYSPDRGGHFEVQATLVAGAKNVGNQSTEFLVQGSDLELADQSTNPALLGSLATMTGGQAFTIDEANGLADTLPNKDRRFTRVERAALWDSPALFLIFLGAVTAEWLIRRRNHLV